MKLAVVCANGKAGKLIVEEAVKRGMDVTAVVRGENQTVAQHTLSKDLFDLTKEDLEELPLLLLAKGTRTRSRLDDYCIDNNISLNPKMEFSSNSLIKDFTLRGFGVGMLTKEHTKEEIKEGKLFELEKIV